MRTAEEISMDEMMYKSLEDRIRRLEKHLAALCGQNVMLLSILMGEERPPQTERALDNIKKRVSHAINGMVNRRPVADFSAPADASPLEAVALDGSLSTGFDGRTAFGLVSWEWEVDGAEFAEGTPLSVVPVVRWDTYAPPGPKTVKLTVTDGDGRRDSKIVNIELLEV